MLLVGMNTQAPGWRGLKRGGTKRDFCLMKREVVPQEAKSNTFIVIIIIIFYRIPGLMIR